MGLPQQLAGWSGEEEIWLGGVRDTVRALAAAMLIHAARLDTLLILLPEPADADIVATDLAAMGVPDAVTLPLSASSGDPESLRDHDYAARLRVLQTLRRRASGDERQVAPTVVCAHVPAAMQAVPSLQSVAAASRMLSVGARIDLEGLQRWLAEAGFHATTAVQMPGEFCQRGGILDVYPPDQTEPVRVELFDDEIESIRHFDPASQRSTESLTAFEVTAFGTAQRENGSIAEYLDEATAVLVIDPERCRKAAETLRSRVADPERFATWEQLLQDLRGRRIALAADLPPVIASAGRASAGGAEEAGGRVIQLPTASVESFTGELDQIRARVDTVAAGHRVIVVADTPADSERMGELLRETDAATGGRLRIAVADLSGGFRITDDIDRQRGGVLVLTGAELFHRSPVRRRKVRAKSKPIDSFLQLEPGDLVVHLSHGIGLYRGIKRIEKQGQQQEHLVVEFDGGTKIFVPAHRIGLIQRYVGGGSSRPKLAKIGGQSWAKHRQSAEQAVTDMASELLEIQAERRTRSGLAFDADSDWQRQFDASFPYTETDDQLAAIHALKGDMETPRPMDRLICGDVGYGKTEVAMRAAFKAVDSGFQVAVLVPTTVLAEQHYHTFCSRMAEFPFDIGRLNRFADSAEERETMAKIKKGQVDIVIGTHRLASKAVEFFNLGLVIIDEEHRFGVAIKERLKAKHSNVDVLTLSATPIPRTLHMALVGVRDISNLETAPAERLSVETRVTRWDERLIRRAVVRELNRGGQIYFVHNRIADIGTLADKLQRIVPEARIGIGHGQMGEGELEQVMIDFIDRKYDILLATTIIESGLDIPNANTIFVDEANRYGLADLHQLRGRVGRYKHQAYCYMLVDKHKHLTPEASKRLRAIEEFSQMGAGFAISMRDLEIRGAGNLLGTQQSGHIAAIGYELYCQLLEDAVRRAQNLPPRLSADVDIDLPVAAFLPAEYVPDLRHKIDLYRRIARLDDYRAIEEIRSEMLDRFGVPPRPVERLLEVAEMRLDAAIWQIAAIAIERDFLVLRYSSRERIEALKRSAPHPVRIVDESRAYIPAEEASGDPRGGDAWLELARSVLRSV
ncbi:transcription-repair coupling factor [Candidatus Laterigemmans baculatus]|uniref:transcription-repair coupling factor n=1 Tax=Candidatus Laterigemmans baculatus TaxID=2770505 RepID=UPI0013DAB862|nr:transcription-repair coupling factor [Candidatus Laterigemmans baculatus]